MTRREFTGRRDLAFSGWVRENLRDSMEGLILQDLDWIFVNYCTGYFILVEVKTNRRRSSVYTRPPQTVILHLLDEFLRVASKVNETKRFSVNPATKVPYRYLGTFILEFIEGTDPDNAREIRLNGKPISRDDLVSLLNLEDDHSLDLIQRYHSDWIRQNLQKQRGKLKGRCSENAR